MQQSRCAGREPARQGIKDLLRSSTAASGCGHRGITDPAAKQRLIVEFYGKFFRNAFPRTTMKRHVYTPVESSISSCTAVNEMLQEHFGQTFGRRGRPIMDPFTGTGTFIPRLLQSGLIAPGIWEQKFATRSIANEIVLLPYSSPAINIEAVYQGEAAGPTLVPFEGICLTDTFQIMKAGRTGLYNARQLRAPDSSERSWIFG